MICPCLLHIFKTSIETLRNQGPLWNFDTPSNNNNVLPPRAFLFPARAARFARLSVALRRRALFCMVCHGMPVARACQGGRNRAQKLRWRAGNGSGRNEWEGYNKVEHKQLSRNKFDISSPRCPDMGKGWARRQA